MSTRLAVAVFKDEKATGGFLKDLDKLTGGLIASVIKSEEFKGEAGETVLLHFAPKGKVKASRFLLVGVGEKTDYKTPQRGDSGGNGDALPAQAKRQKLRARAAFRRRSARNGGAARCRAS